MFNRNHLPFNTKPSLFPTISVFNIQTQTRFELIWFAPIVTRHKPPFLWPTHFTYCSRQVTWDLARRGVKRRDLERAARGMLGDGGSVYLLT